MPQPSIDIAVRVASPDDDIEAAVVRKAAFDRLRAIYRPTGEAAARQAARADEGTRLIAEIDGRIVGTLQFDVHQEHVHLIGVAVHPDFQRMGVARHMVEWVVVRTPGLGRNVVVLDTIQETGNVTLFERLGFRVVQVTVATWCVSDVHPDVHDVRMERVAARRASDFI